mgnify:CR=1 FL=1
MYNWNSEKIKESPAFEWNFIFIHNFKSLRFVRMVFVQTWLAIFFIEKNKTWLLMIYQPSEDEQDGEMFCKVRSPVDFRCALHQMPSVSYSFQTAKNRHFHLCRYRVSILLTKDRFCLALPQLVWQRMLKRRRWLLDGFLRKEEWRLLSAYAL